MKYFTVNDQDQVFECPKVEDISDYDAQECAEQYYHEHDGWEDTWPIMLGMKDTEDGPVIQMYKVEMEAVPHFSAYAEGPSHED